MLIEGVNDTFAGGLYDPGVERVAKNKATLDKDSFMQLLMAQLSNQDPLNPQDSTEFASQLAQYTNIELLGNIETALENSIDANYQLTSSVNNTMAATLIGKEVKVDGNKLEYKGQENIQIGYDLPKEAHTLTLKIFDSQGNVIKEIKDLPKSKGSHKLLWDFTDNNGEKVPEGTYTLKVDAKASNGDAIKATEYKFGTIESVRYTEDGTKFLINGVEYNISEVSEITDPLDEDSSDDDGDDQPHTENR